MSRAFPTKSYSVHCIHMYHLFCNAFGPCYLFTTVWSMCVYTILHSLYVCSCYGYFLGQTSKHVFLIRHIHIPYTINYLWLISLYSNYWLLLPYMSIYVTWLKYHKRTLCSLDCFCFYLIQSLNLSRVFLNRLSIIYDLLTMCIFN